AGCGGIDVVVARGGIDREADLRLGIEGETDRVEGEGHAEARRLRVRLLQGPVADEPGPPFGGRHAREGQALGGREATLDEGAGVEAAIDVLDVDTTVGLAVDNTAD